MTRAPSSEEIEQRIKRAKMLGTLEDHPGWQLMADLLEAQIEINKEALCRPGVDQATTEALRGDIRIMRWCRSASLQATPENYTQWESDLAFQRKRDKMRDDLGFPQETNNEDQQR